MMLPSLRMTQKETFHILFIGILMKKLLYITFNIFAFKKIMRIIAIA